mgnify:CR=1 FL=1
MKSYRGVEGGFALQRAPKEITLFDVIEAVEGQTELHAASMTWTRAAAAAAICVPFMLPLPIFNVIWRPD